MIHNQPTTETILRQQYNNLTREQRESEEGKALAAEIKRLTAKRLNGNSSKGPIMY